MTKTLDSSTRERIRNSFSKLIWDIVRPWAYLDTQTVEILTIDGCKLTFNVADSESARDFFFNGEIEKFIKDLCRKEISAVFGLAKGNKLSTWRKLHEIRHDIVEELIKFYWVKAEVYRHVWLLSKGLPRRDSSDEINNMIEFLDSLIRTSLRPTSTN